MAHIKTYLRIKPTRRQYEDYDCTPDKFYLRVPEAFREQSLLSVRPRQAGTVNQEFQFKHVFPDDAEQSQVFDQTTKEIVSGFLNGYNGTIFAYGQTGTGKTFTVEGGMRRYEDRGLAPRALSMIYADLAAHTEDEITVHVSFLEIYQEVGYDILNPAARTSSVVTHFPKVAVVEGTKGSCVVRNLSTHLAANEEVAQSLLLQGLANRKVAETSMNQRSSRSHAVFTVLLSRKSPGSDVITRSKLHLVDLAGSERVAKTKIDGLQLTEAKYINLSLHHLEGVIIALQQEASGLRPRLSTPNIALYNRAKRFQPYCRPQSRWVSSLRPSSAGGYRSNSSKHIPYRNSLLTMVLRDSLGGNCQTAMIATISLEEENLHETLSTCRFAQRVACVTNTLKKNEEIDDKSMIRRLRRRIAELEAEVAMLKSGQGGGTDLEETDISASESDFDCAKVVQGYLSGRIKDPITAGVNSPPKFRECFRILKKMILEHYVRASAHDLDLEKMSAGRQGQGHQDSNKVEDVHLITKKKTIHGDAEESKADSNKRPNSAPTQQRVSSYRPANRPNSSHVSRSHEKEDKPFPGPQKDSTKPKGIYKSPFERKREAEIKKLSTKVEKVQDNQQEQKRHLLEFQQNVQEQQLQILREEVKKKLASSTRQLTDQRTYLATLKQSQPATEVIQQEQLIEKQLRKRKHKMEKRLQLLDNQLEKLKSGGSEGSAGNAEEIPVKDEPERQASRGRPVPSTPQRTSPVVEHEATSQDGKLNSRQVLERLQKQDRKQVKVQANLEKGRVLTLTKEIEVKEAATRLKLQEFRERLRQSRTDSTPLSGPRLAFGAESPPSHPVLQVPAYATDANIIVDVSRDDVASNQSQDSTEATPLSLTSGATLPHSQDTGPSFSPGQQKAYINQQNRALQNRPHHHYAGTRRTSEKWNNAYNVARKPRTAVESERSELYSGSSTRPNLGTPPVLDSEYEDLPVINVGDVVDQEYEEPPPVRTSPFNKGSLNRGSYGYDPFKDEHTPSNRSFGYNISSAFDNRVTNEKADLLFEYSTPKPRVTRNDPFMSSSEHRAVLKDFSQQQERNPPSEPFLGRGIDRPLRTRLTPEQDMPQAKAAPPEKHFSDTTAEREAGHEKATTPPLKLTNRTFEEALSHMLEAESGKKPLLTFSHEQYDQFARKPRQSSHTTKMTGKLKASPVKPAAQLSPRSPHRMTTSRDRQSSPGNTPERHAKDDSLQARLQECLEMDPFTSGDAGKSYEESDATPYRHPQVLDERVSVISKKPASDTPSQVDIDVDTFTPKIKAFKQGEGEEAFIRSVKEQKDRVSRIRKARKAAEVIQEAWRKYSQKQGVNQGQVKIKYVHYKKS